MAQVSKVTMKLVILPPAPLESGPGAYQIPQIGSSHRVRHTQWHWRDLKCIRSEESQRKGRSDWMETACAISVGSNRGGCFIFPARASALGPTWRRNVQPRLGTVFVTQIHTRHFQLRGRRHPGHKNGKMEHQNRAVTTIGTKTDWKCVKEGTRQMQLELMSRWERAGQVPTGAWLRNWLSHAQDAQTGDRRHTQKVKVRKTKGKDNQHSVCVCVLWWMGLPTSQLKSLH